MEYLTLKQVAEVLGRDPSGVRRYIKTNCPNINWLSIRDQNGQKCSVFTKEDVDAIIKTRKIQGYQNQEVPVPISIHGLFYIIQLLPDIDPNRLKLGFASDIGNRIANHRTTCPNLNVLQTFSCKKYWEKTAIDYLAATNKMTHIGGEVFRCADLSHVINVATQFFVALNSKSDNNTEI